MSHAHDDLPPGEGLFSLNADMNQKIRIGKWTGILEEFHPREGGQLEFVVNTRDEIPFGLHTCQINGRREFQAEVIEIADAKGDYWVYLRYQLSSGDDGAWSVGDGFALPPLVC